MGGPGARITSRCTGPRPRNAYCDSTGRRRGRGQGNEEGASRNLPPSMGASDWSSRILRMSAFPPSVVPLTAIGLMAKGLPPSPAFCYTVVVISSLICVYMVACAINPRLRGSLRWGAHGRGNTPISSRGAWSWVTMISAWISIWLAGALQSRVVGVAGAAFYLVALIRLGFVYRQDKIDAERQRYAG